MKLLFKFRWFAGDHNLFQRPTHWIGSKIRDFFNLKNVIYTIERKVGELISEIANF